MDVSTRPPSTNRLLSRWQIFRTSKTWQNTLRYAVSYFILLLGSAFMLFPMLWMVSSSFKPNWQIFTQPPIWIPQHWEDVRAGNTNKVISMWQVTVNDQTKKVIQIGLRRYTTVINAALLQNLQTAPAAEVSAATATTLDGQTLNIRQWATSDGKTLQVVALAKGDNDTLVVVDVNDLKGATLRLPLDVVNSGKSASIEIGETSFRGA